MISKDSDSISDLSSKGSTAKSIFHRIKSNKNQMKHIGSMLETLMNRLDCAGNDQNGPRKPNNGGQSEPPPAEEGPSL